MDNNKSKNNPVDEGDNNTQSNTKVGNNKTTPNALNAENQELKVDELPEKGEANTTYTIKKGEEKGNKYTWNGEAFVPNEENEIVVTNHANGSKTLTPKKEGTKAEPVEHKHFPLYEKKITVSALSIKELVKNTNGTTGIVPNDKGATTVNVSADFIKNNNPEVGGYFVITDKGEQTYLSTEEFETEYAPVEPVKEK